VRHVQQRRGVGHGLSHYRVVDGRHVPGVGVGELQKGQRLLNRHVVATLAIAFALSSSPLRAQSTAQIPLQFDFLNPGARSLALGSTFIAVADDATAAFTNPAGLTFLGRPEVSFEARFRRLDTPFLSGGRLSGRVTNIGADTVSGPVYSISRDQTTRPYFTSFVYPTLRWAIAAYRHELVFQDNSFLANGAFEQAIFAGTLINEARDLPLSGRRRIKVENYGAAFAYRFNDRVAAGAGVAIYRLALNSDFVRLGFSGDVFGPVDPTQRGSTATQRATAVRPAINAGVIWSVHPAVRVGAVVRQGAAFDFNQQDVIPLRPALSRDGQFRSPHVFGAGARVQPRDGLSFSFDVDRVAYGRLKKDFVNFQAISTGTENQLQVRDGTEVHGGVEYVFIALPRTPAIRAGIWYDPNHAVRYLSDNSNGQVDVRLKAMLPGGDDLVHYCFGFGVPLSQVLEVNAGADLTSKRRYVSGSLVVRLPR